MGIDAGVCRCPTSHHLNILRASLTDIKLWPCHRYPLYQTGKTQSLTVVERQWKPKIIVSIMCAFLQNCFILSLPLLFRTQRGSSETLIYIILIRDSPLRSQRKDTFLIIHHRQFSRVFFKRKWKHLLNDFYISFFNIFQIWVAAKRNGDAFVCFLFLN